LFLKKLNHLLLVILKALFIKALFVRKSQACKGINPSVPWLHLDISKHGKMNSTIVIFPGTNREHDMVMAVEQASGKKPNFVWYSDTSFPKTDLIIVPGGFSYGDYLRSGAMAARSPAMTSVLEHASKGVPVLGVCNGFQILTEVGLLPGALIRNNNLKFICRNVYIKVEVDDSIFTSRYSKGEILSIPVAHNDGNYFANEDLLQELHDNCRIAFKYSDQSGKIDKSTNPNGSCENIAGILNAQKNVLGLMPHPENATDRNLGDTDGRPLFQSLVDAIT
tara:strand:- start:129 stop:965 length:837 start_codon:yes stop_codon:yes gene_type:complete